MTKFMNKTKTRDILIKDKLIYLSSDREWILKILKLDIKPLSITEENNYIFPFGEVNEKYYENI